MSQKVVVQKYGGSSVADIGRLKRVAERVAQTVDAGYRLVVVVSAMGQTTDDLMAKAREAATHPPRRELDMLLSAGERIASALLAMALADLGKSAISFTGSQCGIITSHRHTDAKILEVRPYRVFDELDQGQVVIIAGYQGVSYKREVTTLGRGGSDTTAVALAAALGAEHCEICSDVDGVYSADPRVVSAAEHLERVSYAEMAELAEHGARVLNADAVAFARRAGIVVFARATDGSDKVTRLSAEGSGRAVAGVVAKDGLALIRGDGDARQLAQMAAVLDGLGIVPFAARLQCDGPSLLIDCASCADLDGLRAELERGAAALTVEVGLEAATVVGEGLADDPAHLSRLLRVCEDEALPLRRLDAGARSLTIVLAGGHLRRAVAALHREFIESSAGV